MRIRWTTKANRQLNEIIAWIADDKATNAVLVLERIAKSSSQLALTPFLGRAGRAPGTRELVVPRSGYVLVYRVTRDLVEILGVSRGARRR